MDGRRESLARSVRVMLMIVIAAGLMLAGCSSGPKAMTEQVAVAAQGGVDKIAVNLDSRLMVLLLSRAEHSSTR